MSKILITGAGGFLASQFIKQIIQTKKINEHPIDEIVALDVFDFDIAHTNNIKITKIISRIEESSCFDKLSLDINFIYHLAAVVSYDAEHNFDLGVNVNIKGLMNILEFARKQKEPPFFITTSSLAVFGGKLPSVVPAQQKLLPQSSYGTQKAIGELLVNDYVRKGFIKGGVLRLPTVIVRPGKPNKASSSFMSSIVREPLNSQETICPVDVDLKVWVSSPQKVIDAFFVVEKNAENIDKFSRVVNVPGISVFIRDIINSLKKFAGPDVAKFIKFQREQGIINIVKTWPEEIDIQQELSLGFAKNETIDEIIQEYINNFKKS